jgi:predicted P-loop ATPase
MGKVESAALKAFVTRRVEQYRPAFGRKEVYQPRQCIFVGTTNQSAYLADETGGRRFWPVKVGTIDTDALARDRDVLFAEAVSLYRAGVHWWPDGDFEREHIRPEQEARYEVDAWEEAIARYLDVNKKTSVLISDVAFGALTMETQRIGTADQNRIRKCLERLGWKRGPKDYKGNRPWVRG